MGRGSAGFKRAWGSREGQGGGDGEREHMVSSEGLDVGDMRVGSNIGRVQFPHSQCVIFELMWLLYTDDLLQTAGLQLTKVVQV